MQLEKGQLARVTMQLEKGQVARVATSEGPFRATVQESISNKCPEQRSRQREECKEC